MAAEDVLIDFVIDTAAPVSVIPETVYKEHFTHVKQNPSDVGLRSYSQHEIPVVGQLMVTVMYDGKSYKLPLYVTRGANVCLLGRQ